MKVDVYRSKSKPEYSFIVPAARDITTFTGEVAQTIQILMPLVQEERNVDFSSVVSGEVLGDLTQQIGRSGAGLMKTEAQYRLISKEEGMTD